MIVLDTDIVTLLSSGEAGAPNGQEKERVSPCRILTRSGKQSRP